MTTLREHLEAIRDANHPQTYGGIARARSYSHAVAALATLDAAERLGRVSQRVWPADDRVAVPDPEPSA